MKTWLTYVFCSVTTAIWIVYLFLNENALMFLLEKIGMNSQTAEDYNNLFIAFSILLFNLIIVFTTQYKKTIGQRLLILLVSILFSFLVVILQIAIFVYFFFRTAGKIGG